VATGDNIWTKIHKMWSARRRRRSGEPVPDVLIHDPSATAPRDLDDPFLDPSAQARAAELIAKARKGG
jgi:hypothetical protein